jgi:hypothetical protein
LGGESFGPNRHVHHAKDVIVERRGDSVMGRSFSTAFGKNTALTSLNADILAHQATNSSLNAAIQASLALGSTLNAAVDLFTRVTLTGSVNANVGQSSLLTGLVGYWPLDASSVDSLGTSNGTDTSVTYAAANRKVGTGGASFNGTTSKIVLPNTALQTANLSVSAWIRTTNAGAYQEIVEVINQSTNVAGWEFRKNSSNKVELVLGINTNLTQGSGYQLAASTTSINTGQFFHVVGTYDGANIKVYVNGVLETTTAWASGVVYVADQRARIGVNNYAGSTEVYFWNGSIDEVGIWSRAITAQEVMDLYNKSIGSTYYWGNGYSAPLRTAAKAYWKLDGNSLDSVGTFNGVDSGVTYQAAKINSGASFGGGTNRIVITGGISLGTVFTLSAWINPSNLTGTFKAIFGDVSGGAMGLYLKSTGKLSWWFSAADHLSSATISTSTWTHVALVVDGVRSLLYVNGVLDATLALSPAFTLGQLGNDSVNEAWVGLLDELGVWTRPFSAAGVAELYNSGNGLQYPFGSYGLSSSLVGYWPLDGNSTESVGGFNGSDTLVSYTAGKFNTGATFTGASTSAIALPVIPAVTGSTPRSISFWVKKGAGTTFRSVFQSGAGTDLGWFSVFINGTTSGDVYVSFYNCDFYTVGGLIGTDRFYHVVVCYDGGLVSTSTVRVYVDGVLKTTTKAGATVGEAATGAGGFTIGGDTLSRNFDSTIDELALWNRSLFPTEVASLFNLGAGKTYPLDSSYSPPLTNALMAYWKMDGSSADALGVRNGTDTAISYSSSKINSGANFNGSTSRINFTAIPLTVSWTMSAWCYFASSPPPSGASQVIFSKYATVGGPLLARDGTSSKITFHSGTGHFTNGTVPYDTWTHVAATYDGTTVRFYLNGALDPTSYALSAAWAVDCIGSDSFTGDFMYGQLDELGIWARTLSASEISALYNAGAGIQYPF